MKEKEVPVVNYLPFEERIPCSQYRNVLETIQNVGREFNPQFHEGTMKKYYGDQMRFEMKHGFPLITEREITEKMMRYAIAEIIGFIHGATTLSELENFGLPKFWWKRWTELDHVTNKDGTCKFDLPENDKGEHLGRFSYGGIWGKFPTQDGGTINQWENVIRQMVKYPSALTHHVTNWYPPGIIVPDGKRQVVVAPCHGDVHISLEPEPRKLIVNHVQRSGDGPTGLPYNMVHYPAIGMMLAKVLGYTFDLYIHTILDSHIYSIQDENVNILLERGPRRLPTVTLDFETTGDPVTDFFAIRPEHFHLSDYDPHPKLKVDTVL